MEFSEKLQLLRKNKGMTQEELAEVLYVSRTAVSKWESGRGYPSIDSLKEISGFFNVSIDDLLSGEVLISIAEKENKSNIRNLFDLLFAITDMLSFMLIVLPLYPQTVNGFVYSVNLFAYAETGLLNRILYWVLFTVLVLLGTLKALLMHFKIEKHQGSATCCSLAVGALAVILLALSGETYAVVLAFLLLLVKGILLLKYMKIN